MSYLLQHLLRRPAAVPEAPAPEARPDARVDERIVLNLPDFDGGAHVRVFVEDTSAHTFGRRRLPSPQFKLRITDCEEAIFLEFSVDSPDQRENSQHKIDTLIAALERFRAGLAAESELREARERRN